MSLLNHLVNYYSPSYYLFQVEESFPYTAQSSIEGFRGMEHAFVVLALNITAGFLSDNFYIFMLMSSALSCEDVCFRSGLVKTLFPSVVGKK